MRGMTTMDIVEEYKEFYLNYEISNYGNVRHKNQDGTYVYHKSRNPNPANYRSINVGNPVFRAAIHCLVAEHFIGPRPEGMLIDHIDRNKHNNHVSNLRYATYKENNRNNPHFKDHIHDTITLKNGEERLIARIRDNGHHYKRSFKTKEKVKEWIDAENFVPTYKPSKGGEGHLHTYQSVKGETKYRAMRRIQGELYTKVFENEDDARAWIAEASIESKPERSGRRSRGNGGISERKCKNGDVRYDAKIKVDNRQIAKTFSSREEAEAWLSTFQK